MVAEPRFTNTRPRGPRLGASRAGLPLAAWLALGLGCFAQKPSGESAPTAPPAPELQEPAPPPAELEPAREAPGEKKQEEPASGRAAPDRRGLAPPPPAGAPAPSEAAPAKPASKARSRARPERSEESERAIGGDADDLAREAPALRQRLDRAYRAGSPDCPSARERSKAVCDLAAQICQLTDRDPNVASVAEYCAEAKQRCSAAERRTHERCPD